MRRHGDLVGTARLLRLALRRDRVRIAIWALAAAALVGVSASSLETLYTTPADLATYARIVRDNAAMIIQSGPGYGLSEPTLGAILMNEVAIWTLVLTALLGILMTTRHTRLEEETARAELIRSTPVGRHAAAAAGLSAVLAAQVALAVAVVLAVTAVGYDVGGALAFGAGLVCNGLSFAGIALVTAQVAASSRAATGLAVTALGVAFVVRAAGDVAAPALSWLSPIHWSQAVRAYAGERWPVLVVPVVFTLAMVAVAARLADRRDFGAGLRQPAPGRAEATARLSTPLALAVRLHRGAAIGWATGIAVLGAFYGVLANEAEQMIADNPDMADFLAGLGGGSITDAFLATGLLVNGLLAAGFVVSAVMRMRSEEQAGRADPLLATATSRQRWAMSHLAVSLVAVVLLLAIGGLAEGIGAAATIGDAGYVAEMLAAGVAMSPAPIAIGAVAFLLCAGLPRWALLAWAAMAVSAAIGLLGSALDLPMWLRDVSPFQHVPAMPAAGFTALPLVVLVAAASGLAAAGFAALRRRDVGVS